MLCLCAFGLVFASSVLSACENCLKRTCHETGVCIDGCVPGFADKKCDYQCQSSCKGRKCELDNKGRMVCSEGCENGFCGALCKLPSYICQKHVDKPCEDGFYGSNCDKECNLRHKTCNKKTGKCTECKPGYYGASCERNCTSCIALNEKHKGGCESACAACRYHDPSTTTPPIRSTATTTATTTTVTSGGAAVATPTIASASISTSPSTIPAARIPISTAVPFSTNATNTGRPLLGLEIVGALIFFSLIGLIVLKLCRHNAASPPSAHREQPTSMQLIEVNDLTDTSLYHEINEEEMNPVMPALADYNKEEEEDSDLIRDFKEAAAQYSHLRNNCRLSDIEARYITPSDGDS